MKNDKQTKRAQTLLWVAVVAVVSFILGMRSEQFFAHVAPVFGIRYSADELDLQRVKETYRQIKAKYDGELDTKKLIDGASRGLVAATGDPHTVFMDAEEAKEFDKSLQGDIGGGIGAEIGLRNNRPTIVRPLKDSPSEQAGLKAGDAIVTVNDESVAGLTVDQVVAKIRGEVDTVVKMVVLRGEQRIEASVTRQQITAPIVERDVVDGIGILRVHRFNEETGALARAAAEHFKQQSVSKVILDLRGNPGGTVSAAQELAGLWLDKQPIMTERQGDKTVKTIYSKGNPILSDTKTIVLIDGGSASASEIVAGSLNEYGKATLVGEKSYGKGSVQQLVPLSNGARLKVTEARWYTPKGAHIDKKGIEPQEKVELTRDDLNNERDPQLDKAKQL